METCQNCGRTIGNLETPHLFAGNVVCAGCFSVLSGPTKPGQWAFRGTDAAEETRELHRTIKYIVRVIVYGAAAFFIIRILAASQG